ncbi:DUF2645 family protein [Variovorax sp. efr-133-TYG-130]|uniref:DUF2645 family protein n=1 Tax=Variovorax sp. efr-133-TYG-130 TaxID=3040327 RepID=UPI00255667D3|nr:DUF2645 family protein [Variovorax sp. efr-133-TYG-130]
MKRIGLAVVSAYAFFCIALMLLMPMNKYEWMLDEPSAKSDGLTFCGLPIDNDISTRFFSVAFLIPLFVFAAIQSIREKKIHYSLWIAIALLAIWGWRFFIYYPLC